ncbi:MAG: NADP-dependent oxidoreductase [Proteobacteria bacterium]|nr:NADP-dependent oxidoreductase [Pseudomonadota bacterium]
MKAVRIHSHGGPEVLTYEDVPVPNIQSDELLIRVHAAGVNPIDYKVRQGIFRDDRKLQFPMILGWDFSGEVAAVGSSIKNFKAGDLVFGHPSMMRQGAYAEYIAVKENEIALKPKALDHIYSSVIPLSALTAWQALFDEANLSANQKVLIHAASGGVGHLAVQLAKWKDAYVIGTASKNNKNFLLNCGIDEFIDYNETEFDKVLKNIDVVFDTLGGDVQMKSWPILKREGFLISIVDPNQIEAMSKRYDVHGKCFVVTSNYQELTKIAALVDEGYLAPYLETTFPLAEAAEAHRLIEQKHVRGKIALVVR